MKIAAFNAKNLGWKKVTNKTVVHYLTKIMSQYSVVVILEVMDKSGKAMQKLLKELNNNSSNKNRPYSMTASSRLGRDTYKERFVCFYREDDVKLKACHQYEDNQVGDVDAFAREPFILRFRCPSTKVKDLVLIPVHTKPKDSLKELDELHDVVDAVRKKWRTNKIMILGDFNADGRYLSKRKKKKIRISSAPYHWLIKDDVDTTTGNCNDHTYDRIVVYRKIMLDAVVPGSAKPFNFQKEFNLTDEQTLSISDHYPVEVELRNNQKAPAQGPMALPRTTKTTSIKGQTQKKGPQRKRGEKPAGAEKKKTKPAALQKKKKTKAKRAALQKKKKSESAGAQKKKTQAKPAGAQKKKKTEAAGAEKEKTKAGAEKKTEPAALQKKKDMPAGAEKKRKAEPAGAEKKKKAEPAGAEKKKTKAKPAGAQKKKKTEVAGAEKKKTEPAALQKKKDMPPGAEKKKTKVGAEKKKTKVGAEKKKTKVGAEKKKKMKAGAEKKKKKTKAGAEKQKNTEAAGAEKKKKKKSEAAALQKTKNMRGKRTRGPSSDTPAKRQRLEECQSNGLSPSCLTQ